MCQPAMEKSLGSLPTPRMTACVILPVPAALLAHRFSFAHPMAFATEVPAPKPAGAPVQHAKQQLHHYYSG